MSNLRMDAGNVLALAGAVVGICVVAVLKWALGVV